MRPRNTFNVASLALLCLPLEAIEANARDTRNRNMKFGEPILTSELSGALGGVVASSARGGLGYFRVRRRPGNPRTPGQTIVRTILSGLAAAWRSTLTGAQRTAWAALASDTSSGIDAYIKGNTVSMLSGQARTDVAPPSLSLAKTPLTVTPVVDASAHTIAYTIPSDYGDAPEARVAIFATAPQKASRAARQFNYLFVGVSDTGVTGAQTMGIPVAHPAYNALTGDIVYVRTVAIGDEAGAAFGSVAEGQEFRTTVIA